MEDFFPEIIFSKCDKCLVKKNNIEVKWKSSFYKKKGNGEVLVLLDMIEYEKKFNEIERELYKNNIKNYTIITSLQCRTTNFELPSPPYKIYKYCNAVDFEKLDYKVVLAFGRSIFNLTLSGDIKNWSEFCEYKFNQTYFIYNGGRVYPVANSGESIEKDNFQNFFLKKQLKAITKYLEKDKEENIPEYKIIKIDNPNEFLQQHSGAKKVAWDLETSSLDHFSENFKIKCLTLTFDGITGYYLPFEKINKRILFKFFSNKYSITAEGKYDSKAIEKIFGHGIHIDEDVVLLHHLLNTVRVSNSIKSLAWLIGLGGYDKDLVTYIKKYKIKSYFDIPEKEIMSYAVMDSIVTYRLYEYGMTLSRKQPDIYKLYKEVVIPVIPIFQEMEMNGIDIDFEQLNEFNLFLEKELTYYEAKIQKEFGKININSTQQLGRALEEHNFPDIDRSTKEYYTIKGDNGKEIKKYYYKTGENNLRKWLAMGHHIIDDVLKYRELMKLKTTYSGKKEEQENDEKENLFFNEKNNGLKKEKGLIKYIKKDNKLHPTFRPARTDTWRSSSNNPNFQNQPRRGKLAKKFRQVFKCPENFLFGECDYSGFQLRIAAIYSNDPVMLDIFKNQNGDMHSVTACEFFYRDMALDDFMAKKNEEPYKTTRYKAKNQINFPLLFSDSPYTIYNSIAMEWTSTEIDDYIKENNLAIEVNRKTFEDDKVLTVIKNLHHKFFKKYNGLWRWIKDTQRQAKGNGYSNSYHGARRHLPQLLYIGKDTKKKYLTDLYNIAVNSPVQAYESIEIYKAIIRIDKEMRNKKVKSKMIGMIHDSILFYIHKDEIQQMYDLAITNMEVLNEFVIDLKADMNLGTIWGFGQEVDNNNIKEIIHNV